MNAQTETVEQEIQRKGLTAPRITPNDIAENIASEHYFHYFTAAQGDRQAVMDEAFASGDGSLRTDFEGRSTPATLGLLTFCVLILRNGYTVHGTSACASPENFNAELGKRIARENAVREMWPLMGYALRERLHECEKAGI